LINLIELTIFICIAVYATSQPGRCQSFGAADKRATHCAREGGNPFAAADRCESMDGWQPKRRAAARSLRSSSVNRRSSRNWESLKIPADQLSDDEVTLRLPWDPSNVTVGDMVHGGAIATLADLTVMAAAWCGADAPPQLRGVTVSMALDFMAPARATDVVGVGRVLRRGRSLVHCEAEIVDSDGRLVAKVLATYKVG
jgi:uncharacterized protein (TIGR00369 family)